jgi:hypothetical protein
MRFLSKLQYKQVSSGDSSSELDEDETKGFLDGKHKEATFSAPSSRRTLILVTIANAIILAITTTLFSIWFYKSNIALNAPYRATAPYSPVHSLFDLSPTLKKINGAFYPRKAGNSIAREQPNPVADAQWDEWELTRVYPVSADVIRKMGKDPETVAKLEDSVWGLGDDKYATIFDVYHQVHCLNSLRHIAYGGYCEYFLFCFGSESGYREEERC